MPIAAQSLVYPEALRVDQVDTYHGVKVADPYRWMEDVQSEELHAWLQAQDALRADFLDNQRLTTWVQERIKALGHYAGQGLPTQRGKYVFTTKTEAGQSYGVLYVQEEGHDDLRPLLDFEVLRQRGSAFVNSFSPEGRYLTYYTTEGQSRWMEARVLRVVDGETLPDLLTGIYTGGSSVAWVQDETGFFYTRYPVPETPQDPLGRPQIYYHRVGTPQADDRLVYERPDEPELTFALRVTHDGRYLIVSGSESGGSFNGMYDRLFIQDLSVADAPMRELFPGLDAAVAFEGSHDDLFWIRTSHAALQLRVVAVDPAQSAPTHWEEVIPNDEAAIQAVSVIGDRLVVQYVKDARTLARVFNFEGRLQYEIDHTSPSMSGFADNPDSPITYYTAPQLYDPGTIYRLDVETGEMRVHFRPTLQHDPADFVTEQVFFESKDGTQVPLFLLYKQGLQRDGSNPVFMYGYGAWAWSAFPWQGHMLPWMEMGGVYAIANIRGGGEYGEAWHQAGIRHKKQTGIDDFIAAAEWLIENDYTTPDRMIGNGGSASGVVPAAAAVQRPDLFGASVINFPTLDQIRYIEFGSARSWIPEFGTPEQADDFAALMAYSPYHNLKPDICYPPTWVQVGEKDETTTPMHGYKYAAALQRAQGCDNPVLLKVAWGAGHSYGLTPQQSRETQAEELAFLVKVLGLDMTAVLASYPDSR
ncbi:MAG TPA: prolyl oligopeptidase family serine peptidase [Rhodothermales bacterium]|nr:prolyl oligopeptidase family serine peptidase [Rhodothermales bacterium]